MSCYDHNELLVTGVSPSVSLDTNIERKQLLVCFQCQETGVRQLSRTSDLLILSSLEGNPGQIHTAGRKRRKMSSEGGGDVRRGSWKGEMEKGRSGREREMHRL